MVNAVTLVTGAMATTQNMARAIYVALRRRRCQCQELYCKPGNTDIQNILCWQAVSISLSHLISTQNRLHVALQCRR